MSTMGFFDGIPILGPRYTPSGLLLLVEAEQNLFLVIITSSSARRMKPFLRMEFREGLSSGLFRSRAAMRLRKS